MRPCPGSQPKIASLQAGWPKPLPSFWPRLAPQPKRPNPAEKRRGGLKINPGRQDLGIRQSKKALPSESNQGVLRVLLSPAQLKSGRVSQGWLELSLRNELSDFQLATERGKLHSSS